MAKVKGPLLSLDASGQIGKSQVYASWRGVKYARQHVTPANPRTTAQTTTRNAFQFADDQFKRMLTLAQSPFKEGERGRPLTARNIFIGAYVRNLRGDADFTNYVASPGVNGGLPLASFAATTGAGAGEIDVSADIPPIPVGWTHDAVIYTAFLDRDPAAQMTDFAEEIEDLEAAWAAGPPRASTAGFTGLNTGATYAVSAFLRSTRADGVTAYGIGSTVLVAAG
jgi:hypothetical protein